MSSKETVKRFFNNIANNRIKWKKRSRFYYQSLEQYYSFIIPEGSRVLEIGCGTAELLDAVKPAYGVGVDFSEKMIDIARKRFPSLKFYVQDAEDLKLEEKFDYIIMSDLVSTLWDVQKAFKDLWKVSHKRTKVIISYHNYFWEPILKLGEKLRLMMKQPIQNWLHNRDIENLLDLVGFESIKIYRKLLFPKKIPVINFIFNKIVANLPIINRLCLANLIIARPRVETNEDYSVSIIVPARNEKGNIENAIFRTPKFGKSQEFIFIEGHSYDGTYEEILRVKEKYCDRNIVVMKQSGRGKGNAVREAFDGASGDILMILDADLSMPPEDLPQFYEALRLNRGEFINGSRLVYEMEKQAMRFLNLIGNKFFAMLFTYLLGQRIKDTLCGTKVLFKSDYEKIKMNRKYFGDFDPFGDFDLIFGSAKLNLKIVEVPIRYRERAYGRTQISRFTHGWLLVKMSIIAAKKLKFL